MLQNAQTKAPIAYSSNLTLDQIINMPVADMHRQKEAGERSWFIDSAIRCLDGTQLSVQASSGHYCSPRGNRPPFHALEVGYPTANPGAEWEPYRDGEIFAYVPVELVQAFITQHGGQVLP